MDCTALSESRPRKKAPDVDYEMRRLLYCVTVSNNETQFIVRQVWDVHLPTTKHNHHKAQKIPDLPFTPFRMFPPFISSDEGLKIERRG